MSLVQENMKAHPELYVDPKTLTAEEKRFLAWQSAQPSCFGATTTIPGSIGRAWELGGTGPYYFSHVMAARDAIVSAERSNKFLAELGRPPVPSPWNLYKPMKKEAVVKSPDTSGAAFGGTKLDN